MTQPFLKVELDEHDGRAALRLGGNLSLQNAKALWAELEERLEHPASAYDIDLSGVESIDGASSALLLALQAEALQRGAEVEVHGARDEVQRMLALYACPAGQVCLKAPPARIGMFDHAGRATLDILRSGREMLEFTGDLVVALGSTIRAPRTVQWRDLGRLMERAGADGVPIVLLINFLLGLIMALQGANLLQRFGANIFVADLVGLSITRELAPLMTAIIVAGRSGAAFAAEIGTMKVSEEIDALRTLGLDPQRFLVFPRVLALALVVPLLTLLGDVIGCIGGLLIAIGPLGLTAVGYFTELEKAVGPTDVLGGLAKSVVFAVTITLVACQRGLATRGGAAGVGASTTSAVVIILFLLVALDASFTALFNLLGI